MVTVVSFVTPVGNVQPQITGGGFTGGFTNTAQFAGSSAQDIGYGQYRQYLTGVFMATAPGDGANLGSSHHRTADVPARYRAALSP